MSSYYEWFKALHVIAVISWMAGLLYLPRIYAYHADVKVGSESDLIFQTMERRLLRVIMNPSMVAVFVFGTMNAYIYGFVALGAWFHIKMLCVFFLTLYHGLLARWRKNFVNGHNTLSSKFYRFINEIPTILMIIIVFMVILKPFD